MKNLMTNDESEIRKLTRLNDNYKESHKKIIQIVTCIHVCYSKEHNHTNENNFIFK